MKYAVEKVKSSGNSQICLTERGTFMGYGDLVVDIRNIVDMMELGYPVIFDATHSIQKPSAARGKSGGCPQYIPYLSEAVGVKGFFFETHFEPEKVLSDGANMIKIERLEMLLKSLLDLQSTGAMCQDSRSINL